MGSTGGEKTERKKEIRGMELGRKSKNKCEKKKRKAKRK